MAAKGHSHVLKHALSKQVISEDHPLVLFFDLIAFRHAIKELLEAFPSHFFHTLAVKANPTLSIMREALQHGMGFETASMGELVQALETGAKGDRIVFDSPVKTRRELQLAFEAGVHVNFDNWQELERAEAMMREHPQPHKPWLGLRINPQVGAGKISSHSTGTATSKFGIGLQDDRKRVLDAYSRNPWLNAVHVHVGSQGVGFELAAKGIREVVQLAVDVNAAAGRQQVTCIDIGGGMPVNFESDDIRPTFREYAMMLEEAAPELFTGEFQVVTEFGRSLCAKAGWFGSRVEYTKVNGGRHIAAQHAGADIAIRTIYHPTIWPLRVTVMDSKGDARASDGDLVEQDIAGPCCIQGDIIAHQRPLPPIQAGDILVISDVGGYYHSSYSRYNCRQAPAVIGYEYEAGSDGQPNAGSVALRVLQRAETVEESLELFRRT